MGQLPTRLISGRTHLPGSAGASIKFGGKPFSLKVGATMMNNEPRIRAGSELQPGEDGRWEMGAEAYVPGEMRPLLVLSFIQLLALDQSLPPTLCSNPCQTSSIKRSDNGNCGEHLVSTNGNIR